MRLRRVIAGTLGALVVALIVAPLASAQTGALVVHLRQATLDPDGTTRIVVSVTGSAANTTLSRSSFTISEAGKEVPAPTVTPLLESKTQAVLVDLVMDVSGSTAGSPIANAKSAAKTYVSRLPAGVQVGLVAFGDTASERHDFTTDKASVSRAIDGLSANGSTALYDAINLSASRLNRHAGQHNMVVFSDGKDTISRTTLAAATAAAKGASAPVTTVGLKTGDFDSEALTSIASQTGGRLVEVSQSAALANAFAQVARDIASQYVVAYKGTDFASKSLDLSIVVKVGAVTASDAITVISSRVAPGATGVASALPESGLQKPLVGFFSGKFGLYVGIGAAFIGILLFLGMLVWRPSGGRAAKVLQRGLRLYTRADRKKVPQGGMSGSAIGRRAVELVDRVPKSAGFEQKLQLLLDRSGWPLRSTEFIVFQILGLAAGAILGFGLFQKWWLGLVLMVGGAMVPRLILLQKVSKRGNMFLSQLPDTLQLLAGSLQAGYGFMQAIDTIVKEAPAPTSTEFGRVLTEARLGMAIEDALQTMADRMGSEDFRWVVLAINIQRQVGGNLAALLSTVADTLREREQVRRQIKVLSAEGRLSAVILVILPFAIAGYIAVANPTYLKPLFSTTFGHAMIAFAMVMMVIGIFWMKKIIKIDV